MAKITKRAWAERYPGTIALLVVAISIPMLPVLPPLPSYFVFIILFVFAGLAFLSPKGALWALIFSLGFRNVEFLGIKPLELFLIIFIPVLLLRKLFKKGLQLRWAWTKTPLDWPITLLLLLSSISLAQAVNLRASLLELSRLIVVVALYYLLVNMIRNERMSWYATGAWITASGVVALLGGYATIHFLIQGNFPVWAYHSPFSGRLAATFHDPNYYASFLVPSFLLAFGLTVWGRFQGQTTRWTLALLCFLLEWNILFTFSRSGWAASIGGITLLWALNWWKRSDRLTKRSRLMAMTAGVLVVILIWLGTIRLFSPGTAEFAEQRASVPRVVHQVDQDRFTIWQGAWRMIKANPWGVGLKNFTYRYPEYSLPGARVDHQGIVAHNLFLKVWTELGIQGLLVLLWLLGILGWEVSKALTRVNLKNPTLGPPLELDPLMMSFTVATADLLLQGLVLDMLSLRHLWFFIGMLMVISRTLAAERLAAEA